MAFTKQVIEKDGGGGGLAAPAASDAELPEQRGGEVRPGSIRTEPGEVGRQTPKARQQSCRSINRTADTRIFRTRVEALRLNFSIGYRGVRCLNCITAHNDAQLISAKLMRVVELHLLAIRLPNDIQMRHAAHMEQSTRTSNFWWFQLVFWTVAGTALFLSGVTQMPLMQAAIRNLFLLTAGFLSSFFLAQLIDELRWMAILRLRLASYCLAYFIALLCVVVINAIHFTLRDIALADITFGQWFSGAFNLALIYAFWSELFIQQIYVGDTPSAAAPPPDKLVVEHQGRHVSVPLASIVSIIAAGDYVEIKTSDRTYLERQALHKLAEILGDDAFPRVHRSRLVNRNHVESVTPLSKGRYRLHLMDGSSLTTSRGYRETVQSNFLAGIV